MVEFLAQKEITRAIDRVQTHEGLITNQTFFLLCNAPVYW